MAGARDLRRQVSDVYDKLLDAVDRLEQAQTRSGGQSSSSRPSSNEMYGTVPPSLASDSASSHTATEISKINKFY